VLGCRAQPYHLQHLSGAQWWLQDQFPSLAAQQYDAQADNEKRLCHSQVTSLAGNKV